MVLLRNVFKVAFTKRRTYSSFHHRIENVFHDERTWAIGSMLISLPALFWVYERHNSNKFKNLEQKLLEGINLQEETPKQPEPEIPKVLKKEEIQEIAYPPVISAKYLLVGGGTASAAAMEAIYEHDHNADILIVSADEYLPYMKPPLSKELWFTNSDSAETFTFSDWQGNKKTIFYRDNDFFESINIAVFVPGKVRLLKKRRGIKLDIDSRTLTLDNGTLIKYHKILLATGGTPKMPNFVKDHQFDRTLVSTFRNAKDFLELKKVVENGKNVTIYGGGFLGSELVVALKSIKNGGNVTQIIPEEGNLSQIFPSYLSKWTTSKLEQMGIKIFRSSKIKEIQQVKNHLNVKLESGETINTDHLVIAVGITPDIELAKSANLEIDESRGGIVTNAELETRSNVFAAGDVISFYDVALGRRRVEHHDHAVLSGITAGSNMIGKRRPYKHQSMYWSDLGPEISLEAVGITDSSFSTVSIWAKPDSFVQEKKEGQLQNLDSTTTTFAFQETPRGLVFYLKEKTIVGVLLLNVPGKISEAKKILLERKNSNDIPNVIDRFHLYSK